MKKFFSLLMATCVTLCMLAVTPAETGKKVDPTGRATKLANKKLTHNKQVAKVLGLDKLERKAMPTTKPAPVAKATQEDITLNYDAFAGMMYYDEEEQWWIGLSCDDMMRTEYGHNLNLEFTAPAASPCGTYTTEDFDYDFTHLTTPFSFGSIHFTDITMTLSFEKISANLERYTLTATLVGEDGNTYTVNATHENIVAKGEVELYVEDALVEKEGWTYSITAKHTDLAIHLVVDNSDIIGVYGKNMIIWDNSYIIYKGTELTPLSFKAQVDLATHTETGALAYLADVTMMGNDTVNYHFILAAPLPTPTDTVELTAIDLEVDDSWAMMFGTIDFYATTPEFSIRGGWQAEFAEEGTFPAAIFLDDAYMNTITSLQAEVTVTLDQDNNWAVEGTMLGSDNKVYNLHLSRSIPEQKDTVLVAFETSAQAKYYPHLDNDIQLLNENELYSASINVSGVEMGGEFDEEYIISFFTYLEVKNATAAITVAEIKDGKLYQVGDTTKMEADFVTFEGVLYQVRLWYVAPTPTQTVKLDIKDAECIVDFEYNQAYNLVGYTEDMQTAFVVTVYATSKDDIPGTFVNDGMFGKFGEGQYDFDASNSYIGKYNESTESYDLYYIQKGQFTVTLDENDNIALTASVIAEDAIQYDVTLTSKYEEPHIEFDAEEGAVERVYGADTEVTINDRIEEYGLVYLQLTDNVQGDVTAVYFVVSEADAETILPVGTYEINSTWMDGTVTASTGIEWDGTVIPSYYAGYTDGWLVEPYYFFQTGTVVVDKDAEGKLTFDINTVNSCGIPVHIVYGTPATGVENIDVNVMGIQKQIVDGQFVIIRDGKAYSATGAQVK